MMACLRSFALRPWVARAAIPWLFLAGLPVLASGCIIASPGRSLVAQGRAYAPGDALYDRFFAELYQTQLVMAAAPEDETQLRQGLAHKLGISGNSPGALASAVDQRIQGLVVNEVRVRLVLIGEPGEEQAAVRMDTQGTTTEEQRAFLASLEATVRGELSLMARVASEQEKLLRLLPMAAGLASNVDNQFRSRGLTSRAEVKKNIRDAQTLIPLMQARASEVSGAALHFIKKLEAASQTLLRDSSLQAPSTPSDESSAAPAAPAGPRKDDRRASGGPPLPVRGFGKASFRPRAPSGGRPVGPAEPKGPSAKPLPAAAPTVPKSPAPKPPTAAPADFEP